MSTETPSSLGRRELECLYRLARELLRLEDYDRLLDAVVNRSLEALGGERGFLVLERGEGLDFKVVRNWSREELEGEPISRSILARVFEADEPLLIEDALSDDRLGKQESVLRMGIRSVLAAPVRVDGERVGAIYLESRALDQLFGETQRELFEHILELASNALENCMKRLLLEQRNRLLEGNLLERHGFRGIITRDPAFLKILETVAQVATSDLPVLVQGPSGTGKELIVRALHRNSRRSKSPFVTVNCGAIQPALLESELFGHVRGAFTGATRDKTGVIDSADGGSVFLDEVGELPQELQVKLLRTLQFGELQPVGATRTKTVDVRFLAATNRELEREVEAGNFREDLFYRLNVVTLELPPLKDRPDDVLPLFYHFLEKSAEAAERPVPDLTPKLERTLQTYDWPGNVRQLENEAKRLLAVTPAGQPLTVDRLSSALVRSGEKVRSGLTSLAEQQKELVELHLRLSGGNRTRAAESLGVSREGLRKMMKRFGLS